jgi:hypothetical protein
MAGFQSPRPVATTISASGLRSSRRNDIGSRQPPEEPLTVPIFDVRTMDQRVAASLANRRFAAWLLAVFSGIAVLLAAVGL